MEIEHLKLVIKIKNNDIDFRETLLNQIKEYLDGKITKEEYYSLAEPFYTQYAHTCNNTSFLNYFLSTIPDACLFYIDESDSASKNNDELFYQALSEAYLNLQKLRKYLYQQIIY